MPRNFTIAEKCKILDEYESVRAKQPQREFAKEKGIDPKTLRNILGKAVEYRELANTKHITDRKRKREAKHQDIDQALIKWFDLLESSMLSSMDFTSAQKLNHSLEILDLVTGCVQKAG